MTAQLIPGPSPLLETQLLGRMFSSIAYGIVFMLFISCFCLLLKTTESYTKNMRRFLFAYIVVMFLLSTMAQIEQTVDITMALFPGATVSPEATTSRLDDLGNSFGSHALIYVVLGCDTLMIWRCLMLYAGVRRSFRIVLFVGCSLHFLTASVFGVISYVINLPFGVQLLLIWSFLDNIVLSVLIAGRILYYQRRICEDLGTRHTYTSQYTRIIAICVESCALIFLFSGIALALYFRHPDACHGLLLILPQICVISPYLLILRVAQNRISTGAVSVSPASMTGVRHDPGLGSIRFHGISTCTTSVSSISGSEAAGESIRQ